MIKKIKTNRGITLIALIITIIVLLILAVVSIRAITNEGIITKASDAKTRYTKEQEKEKIQIGYSEYKMSQYTEEKLSKPVVDGADVGDLTDGAWNIVFKDTNNKYSLSKDGIITPISNEEVVQVDFEAIKADLMSNPSKYLEKADELEQDIVNRTDIGIGTDGNVVNLDLWTYGKGYDSAHIGSTGAGCLGGIAAAYKGSYTKDGRIEGTIPQLIYSDGNVYEVTATNMMFKSDELLIPPEIPTTVTDCSAMFAFCTNLEKAPKIPNGVINCQNMFYGCSNLKQVLEIPYTVEKCSFMFHGCIKLANTIIINSNPVNYDYMLWNVGSAENRITLTGDCSAEVLEAIRQTGNAEYITVEK